LSVLKCILLDDELPGLRFLKLVVEQLAEIEIVKAYDNPIKFLEDKDRLQFDLCIMDIEMPNINGLELARQLGGKMVIFVTAYSEYAADAFDLNVVDYVRKPISKERLELAIDKARSRFKSDDPVRVAFNTDQGKYLLDPSHITHIVNSTIDSRDKDVYMRDGNTVCIKNVTFARLEQVLPVEDFCRINKKEIIAFRIVKSFTHDIITSTLKIDDSAITFPLSNIYRARFLTGINR
jgi:two-component system LytT family response regulator